MSDLHRALAAQALRLVPPDESGEMDDKSSSALQFACMALVAMQVAEERDWGCRLTVAPRDVGALIDPTGLWIGDAAFAFLAIGQQLGDVSTPQWRARKSNGLKVQVVGGRAAIRAALEKSIREAHVPEYLNEDRAADWLASQRRRLAEMDRAEARIEIALPNGPLLIHPVFTEPFVSIGWIENGQWSPVAQSSLWRLGFIAVPENRLDVIVLDARHSLPEDVARAVEKVWRAPTALQVRRRADLWMADIEEFSSSLPAAIRAKRGSPSYEELCVQVERDWPRRAANDMRNLVEARWRVELGWDSGAALLPLFHDRLAGKVTDALLEAA